MKKFESLEKYRLMENESKNKSQSYFGGLPTLVPLQTLEKTKVYKIDGTYTVDDDSYTDNWRQD